MTDAPKPSVVSWHSGGVPMLPRIIASDSEAQEEKKSQRPR